MNDICNSSPQLQIINNPRYSFCYQNIDKAYSHSLSMPFNLPSIDYNIPTIESFLTMLAICIGLWLLSKLFWMIVYQIRYGGNAGEDYFNHGKEYVKRKYKN